MDATTIERQKLIEAVSTLPDENLHELASFLAYLRYKSDHAKAPNQSASSFLHAIAGLGRSGQQDISQRNEEILRQEIDPKRKPFAEVLSQIPNVGNDADFERVWDDKEQDSEALDILLATIPEGFQYPFDIQDFVNSPAINQELL